MICGGGVGGAVGVAVNVGTIPNCGEGVAEASPDGVAIAEGDKSARVGLGIASADLGGI